MGFRYRQSINLGGGFRINLSKSGIGYSWGTKGYRVTKTARGTIRKTYSIPGTGISYVEESGSRNRSRSQQRSNSSRTPSPYNSKSSYSQPLSQTASRTIQSAEISQFKEAEEGSLSDALERTICLDHIGTILLWCALLVVVNPAFLLIPVVGGILKIAAHTAGSVKLEYTFDPEKAEEHTRRIDAWQLLAEGNKEWQVLTEQYNSNRKINAGAGSSVSRVDCKIQKGHPYYIKTNVDTIQILLHNKERLIIMPDKVFFVRNRKVGMIDYSDFKIRASSIRFIESASVPKDAQIIGQTWQYVNKNGTPDRRFKNNRQLPICLYGQINLSSSAGLNVEMQISNVQNTRDFAELIG
jgi:hypothetical protein